MSKVSIQIESTDTLGNKKQKSLTNINPEASSAQLKSFAQNLIALTNQTYSETNRIEKINVDTEDTSGKITPTFTVGDFEVLENIGYRAPYTYNGDGKICANITGGYNAPFISFSEMYVFLTNHNTSSGSNYTVTITTTETDTYAAATVTKTFTWEG